MRVVPNGAHVLLLVMSLGGFTERVNRPMVKKRVPPWQGFILILQSSPITILI